MAQNQPKKSRFNATVSVYDANGVRLFRAPGDTARHLCAIGAAEPNEGKRVWKVTLLRRPLCRVRDSRDPSIHSFKTAAPVYRETMGDEGAKWRSQTYSFKPIEKDLLWRIMSERVDQGFVHKTAEGYRQNLGND